MMTIDLSAFSHTDPNDAATLAAMAEPAQTRQEYPNDMEGASPADALLVENTTNQIEQHDTSSEDSQPAQPLRRGWLSMMRPLKSKSSHEAEANKWSSKFSNAKGSFQHAVLRISKIIRKVSATL